VPGFEPFFDYDKFSPEMASDLYRAMIGFNHARDAFLRQPPSPRLGAEVIRTSREMDRTLDVICQSLWTLPVMVHVAGERQTEVCEDCGNGERIVQRCKRCGSTLHLWHEHLFVLTPQGPAELEEEDIPWWDEDSLVAKGTDGGRMTMYRIDPDRTLEKHEMECVSLVDIGDYDQRRDN
jgi:hypothetical protein